MSGLLALGVGVASGWRREVGGEKGGERILL